MQHVSLESADATLAASQHPKDKMFNPSRADVGRQDEETKPRRSEDMRLNDGSAELSRKSSTLSKSLRSALKSTSLSPELPASLQRSTKAYLSKPEMTESVEMSPTQLAFESKAFRTVASHPGTIEERGKPVHSREERSKPKLEKHRYKTSRPKPDESAPGDAGRRKPSQGSKEKVRRSHKSSTNPRPPHYKALGISRTASQDQIKGVYKQLVSQICA